MIDWRSVRPHRGARATGFEEVVRQLILADPPAGTTGIESRGVGADGGVEIVARLSDGSEHCWQAKYFIDQFGNGQIAQLRSSFRTAFAYHPAMTVFSVALPRNLSGSAGAEDLNQRRLWNEFKSDEEQWAADRGRQVVIDLWDETVLITKLTRRDPIHTGMLRYWFDETVLTRPWLEARFASTCADLAERFSPQNHVDVAVQRAIDGLLRRRSFVAEVARFRREIALRFGAGGSILTGLAVEDQAWVRPGLIALDQARALYDGVSWEPGASGSAIVAAIETSSQLIASSIAPFNQFAHDQRTLAVAAGRAVGERIAGLRSAMLAARGGPSIDIDMLSNPAVLITGEAGAGKSHLLAHSVEVAIEDDAPAILWLGQHFGNRDPREDMLARTGFADLPFDEFLGMVQAAATATGRMALLAIDALNEALSPERWLNELSGLTVDIGRFDHIAFVVSCRETYLDYCVPEGWSGVTVEHHGFEDNAAAAAKVYLDRNGIDRPAAPFLNPEFTNPLFLSTCVRALLAQNERAFPLGLEGVAAVFGFWLRSVERTLVRKGYARIAIGDGRLRAALERFADELAIQRLAALPLAEATALFEQGLETFVAQGPRDLLLHRLVDEGVLRRDVTPDGTAEEVAFTFQRFSDHFVADALIRLFGTADLLGAAMELGGDAAYLIGEDGWEYAGVVEALMAQVPELAGRELPSLSAALMASIIEDERDFLGSLRWRGPSGTGPDTVSVIEALLAGETLEQKGYFDTLLHVSSDPAHALNANYLDRILRQQPMAERDTGWGLYLVGATESDGPLSTLLDWCATADTARAEPERLVLSALAVAWMTSAFDRAVRDKATKALAALIVRSPAIAAPLLRRMLPVDDAYVRERVLAAAYGGLLGATDDAALEAAAVVVLEMVFAAGRVEGDGVARHFGRCLVEFVANRVPRLRPCLPTVLPPYATMPIDRWPAIEELIPRADDAYDIISSVVGFINSGTDDDFPQMAGDFGRYTMGSVDVSIAAARLVDGVPGTREQIKKVRWALIESLAPAKAAAASRAHAGWRALDEVWDPGAEGEARTAAARAAFERERDALAAALPATLAGEVRSEDAFPAMLDHLIERFDILAARRWIAARVFELGWNPAVHRRIDRNLPTGGSRHEHDVERIGKKYQWIAFHELLGYFQDHHWYLRHGDDPAVLQDFLELEYLDIDPSFLGADPLNDDGLDLPAVAIGGHDRIVGKPDAARAWTATLDDLPDVPSFAETVHKGRRWYCVTASGRDQNHMAKSQSEGPMRVLQCALTLIIIETELAEEVLARVQGTRVANSEAMRDSHAGRELFGERRPEVGRDSVPLLQHRLGTARVGHIHEATDLGHGEYDLSGTAKGNVIVPRGQLVRGLGLRPADPWSIHFVDAFGEPAFVDVGELRHDQSATLVRADLLDAWLEREGLVAAWLLWAEKDGGMGWGEHFQNRGGATRRTFGGLWWRSGSGWAGSNWVDSER